MRLYAIICYSLAAAAESGGLVFVLLALRQNRAILRRWADANPNQNPDGSWGQIPLLNEVVPALLGASAWRGRLAAGLIAVGILAGTLGNFTGLPS